MLPNVTPILICGKSCCSLSDVVECLRSDPENATTALADGTLAIWIWNEIDDRDLAGDITSLVSSLRNDRHLLALLACLRIDSSCAPHAFHGAPLKLDELTAFARDALDEDAAPELEKIRRLFEDDVLIHYSHATLEDDAIPRDWNLLGREWIDAVDSLPIDLDGEEREQLVRHGLALGLTIVVGDEASERFLSEGRSRMASPIDADAQRSWWFRRSFTSTVDASSLDLLRSMLLEPMARRHGAKLLQIGVEHMRRAWLERLRTLVADKYVRTTSPDGPDADASARVGAYFFKANFVECPVTRAYLTPFDVRRTIEMAVATIIGEALARGIRSPMDAIARVRDLRPDDDSSEGDDLWLQHGLKGPQFCNAGEGLEPNSVDALTSSEIVKNVRRTFDVGLNLVSDALDTNDRLGRALVQEFHSLPFSVFDRETSFDSAIEPGSLALIDDAIKSIESGADEAQFVAGEWVDQSNEASFPMREWPSHIEEFLRHEEASEARMTLVRAFGRTTAHVGNACIDTLEGAPVGGIANARTIRNIVMSGTDRAPTWLIELEDDSVYVSGNGRRGVGGRTTEASSPPRRLEGFDDVVEVASRGGHVLLRGARGSVASCGLNGSGQLGHGDKVDRRQPVVVAELKHITDIAAGIDFSIACDASGRVWAWGRSSHGQAGRKSVEAVTVPRIVRGMPRIKSITAGYDHVLATTRDGRVYTWGMQTLTWLRKRWLRRTIARPVRVPGLDDITICAATATNSVALHSDGTVTAWSTVLRFGDVPGPGAFHRFGLPSGAPIVDVRGGLDHFVVLDALGSAWMWTCDALRSRDLNGTTDPVPRRLDTTGMVKWIAAGPGACFVLDEGETRQTVAA